MIKEIFLAFFMICTIVVSGQTGFELDVFAGPNITNIIRRQNSQPVFVGLTDRRPYSSINYLLGVKLKKSVNKFDLATSLMFEKIRNSSNKFNEKFVPGVNDNINYLATTIEISKAPLVNSNVKFGLGWSFYYALNKRFGRRETFRFKRSAWGPTTSLYLPITNRITFNTTAFFGINNIRKDELGNVEFITTQKPFSFQFILNYTIVKPK